MSKDASDTITRLLTDPKKIESHCQAVNHDNPTQVSHALMEVRQMASTAIGRADLRGFGVIEGHSGFSGTYDLPNG